MKKSEVKYILKWAKRIKAINYLGGKCGVCGEDDIYVLDFHHENSTEKEFQISLVGIHKSWDKIKEEIEKCNLLCRNCHIKVHFSNGDPNSSRRKIRKQIFEYKGTFSCEECGYTNKDGLALDLHHIKNKLFNISDGIGSSFGYYSTKDFSLTERIIQEIDKCKVLCRNCHVKKHVDMKKQNKLRCYILEKVNTMKDNKRIDVKRILELRKQGLSTQKIADALGYNRSSVDYHIYPPKTTSNLSI